MAIGAADVIAPVFATTKVIALFLAGVARKTSLSRFFRGLVLERNNFGGIAFCDMVLAGTMARFATRDLALPTADLGKLSMRSMRISFELFFVTVFTGFAADITGVSSLCERGGLRLSDKRL